MNATKAFELIDPVDDSFPISIRGSHNRPNVPGKHYVNQFWALHRGLLSGELTPWRSEAPQHSFRFRPFGDFDALGRSTVAALRQFERWKPVQGGGSASFPYREAYLTKMHHSAEARKSGTSAKAVPQVSTERLLDRAVEEAAGGTLPSPLAVQRDVGRIEATIPCAGKLPVDPSMFPFRWNTEDLYEYEVAKVRQQRFVFENQDSGPDASECTYKVIITTLWDHHADRLAEDLSAFFRDVGRQVVEEKLIAVRAMLQTARSGSGDGAAAPELLHAFDIGRSPFDPTKAAGYDAEEKAAFVRRELRILEQQCVSLLARIASTPPDDPLPGHTVAPWPTVEKLEPWVKMVETWSTVKQSSYTDIEMSTKKYEFRKYFRVIKVKLPFYSAHFERRLLDTKSWLHRHATSEYHFIARRNVVYDQSAFPLEHAPLMPATHDHHRLFSFALDWQSPPFDTLSVEPVLANDTWESVAARLGSTVEELVACNEFAPPGSIAKARSALVVGRTVVVPPTATKRVPYAAVPPSYISLNGDAATASSSQRPTRLSTWAAVAEALKCDVGELKELNPHVDSGAEPTAEFPAHVTQLRVPATLSAAACAGVVYAGTEPTFEGDTFETVALRLGTTVEALRSANPNVERVAAVRELVVPASSRFPRRLTEPLLSNAAATEDLFARTTAEAAAANLPPTFPTAPDAAHRFPSEFHTISSQFPAQSAYVGADDNWLAYTSAFLDPKLSVKADATPTYNVNRLWPMQQVPGTLDSTPFEEDQTWFLHNIPMHSTEIFHPEGYIQDLPRVNNEQFAKSLEWRAP